jgi:hypothetical protein
MRQLLTITALLIGGLGVSRAATSTQGAIYLEPSAVYAFPGKDFKDAAGGGLTLGVRLNERSAIELEGIYFKSEVKRYSIDVDFAPVLLKYKWSIAPANGWDVFVAPAVGAVFEKATTRVLYVQNFALISSTPGNVGIGNTFLSYTERDETIRDTAFTGGAEIGAAYHFNDHVSLGASATLLELSRTDITTSGSMALVEAKLGIRF